jgi:GNAT superfamily N-acetyltransferase
VSDARAAALAFMRDTRAACADRVEQDARGTIFVTPSLPNVYSLNTLVVEDPQPDLDLDAVEALLGERIGTTAWASALIADELAGERLEAEARERGWKVEHELLMELRREPDRVVDTSTVQEGDGETALTLASRWFREDFADQGEAILAELDRYAEREWRSRPTRLFVSPDRLAMCKLWSDGTTAQVEDVFTAPEARGHGHARTLLTRAIEEARAGGHDLVFILADDDDTPKELYARLGFDPLGRLTRVVRPRPG